MTAPPDRIADFAFQMIAHVSEAMGSDAPSEVYAFGPLAFSLKVRGARYRDRLTTAIGFARQAFAPSAGERFRILAIDGSDSPLGRPPEWHFAVSQIKHLVRLHERPDIGLTVRHDPETNTWQMVSARDRLAIVWTADAAALPDIHDAAPLRSLLHWMTVPGIGFLAHAAAVGSPGKGALLAGRSGSGKSTTVAAAVRSGLVTTGDDFILVDPQSGSACALYDSIKLDRIALALLPGFVATSTAPKNARGEKTILSLASDHLAGFVPRLPIACALLPRVAGASRTTFAPASASEALLSLVPSTVFLLGGGEAETTVKAARLLRCLPAFRCELGSDPVEAAAAISDFLDRQPA